ncbi:putative motility protein [Catenovulum sediminis]|uniref:Cytoplasmic protein n=1 Tax=Catenovulum sediminis TaxID=1740262 RepID=A0ABV1RMI5_9ALTE|nr:hypothetical protein [Catenovulum sediminis]
MDVNPTGVNQSSVAGQGNAELRGAQLAKKQQEAEGQATLDLLQSAEVSPPRSADPAIGQNINIKV